MTPNPAGSPMPDRRRPVRTRCLLAAASGLAVLLAAGCSGGSGGNSPVSGTITIAAVPGVDDAPIWLAQQKGLFTAAGLNVRITKVNSDAAALAAVANGTADIAASDYGNIIAWQVSSNGTTKPLYLVADGYDAGTGNVEILVKANGKGQPTLSDPAQLSGKTVATPSQLTIDTQPGTAAADNASPSTTIVGQGQPSSLDAVAASTELSDYLLNAGLAVTWEPMPESEEISKLQSGQVQAALLTQPYLYEAEAKYGDYELSDIFSGQTAGMPLSGYVAADSWARSNSQAIADFRSALDNAQTQAGSVGLIQQTLQSAVGIPQAAADMASLGTYPTAINENEIQRVARLMNNGGVVTVNTAGFLNSLLDLPAKS
jgi:NitT/TauT family transport system substrate-binding protein